MNTQDEQWWVIRTGEYVMGTLDEVDRLTIEKLIKYDAEVRAQVVWWQEKLAGMNDSAFDLLPPERVWHQIESQINGGTTSPTATIVDEALGTGSSDTEGPENNDQDPPNPTILRMVKTNKRRIRLWRASTGLATAACLVLSVLLYNERSILLEPTGINVQYDVISVINDENGQALWVVNADVNTKLVRITALAPPEIANDKSFELWVVKSNSQGVTSMGLLPVASGESIVLKSPGLTSDGAAFAVSLEPVGGSPENAPTGPVLYQGPFQKLTLLRDSI